MIASTIRKAIPELKILICLLFIAFLGNPAVSQTDKADKEMQVSEQGTKYEIVGWESNVIYNPYTYTYYVWNDPVVGVVKEKEVAVPDKLDRPPVFSKKCLQAKDIEACTNEQIQEFVLQQDFDYPEGAEEREQSGMEYVMFVLNEKGKIEGNVKVLSKRDPCRGCSGAAVDIVMAMEDKWQPAMKDGKPVAAHLTIPIRFRYIEN